MAIKYADFVENATGNIKDELVNILNGLGYDKIKFKSSFRFQVLTDENRIDVLGKLEAAIKMKYPQAYWDADATESSVGAIVVDRYMVGAAPASKQGKASAGLKNEHTLFNMIEEINKRGPMKILFKAKTGKDFLVEDVVGYRDAGRDTSGRKKADIVLIKEDGTEVPISLKKDKAEMWESADSYWAVEAKKIVDEMVAKGKVSLTDKGRVKYMTPNIGKKANKAEATAVVFGEDILRGKGCVIEKTFNGKFTVDGDTAIIEVTKIVTSLSDLKGEYEVWFLIRNDSSRKGSKIYPGLRVLAVKKSRINRNVIQVK
jgi:hypothetical protein